MLNKHNAFILCFVDLLFKTNNGPNNVHVWSIQKCQFSTKKVDWKKRQKHSKKRQFYSFETNVDQQRGGAQPIAFGSHQRPTMRTCGKKRKKKINYLLNSKKLKFLFNQKKLLRCYWKTYQTNRHHSHHFTTREPIHQKHSSALERTFFQQRYACSNATHEIVNAHVFVVHVQQSENRWKNR